MMPAIVFLHLEVSCLLEFRKCGGENLMLCMYVALEQDLKHLLKNVRISFRKNISFLLFFFFLGLLQDYINPFKFKN